MSALTRRQFLGAAGGVAGAAAIGTLAWSRLVDDQVRSRSDSGSGGGGGAHADHILVVIEMAGGNDGLNTLVPADGRYRDARPTLGVDEAALVALDGETAYALHPSLSPLAPIWADGRLAAIQGTGFDGQSRSHFAATDMWRAAGQATTSWLGRWLDATGGDELTPLRAISIGVDSRMLTAEHSMSTVVAQPDTFHLLTPEGPSDPDAIVAAFQATAAPLNDERTFAAAQQAIPATVDAVRVLEQAAGAAPADEGPGEVQTYGQAADRLRTAAQIIGLDIGTQVVVVGTEGFDTHAAQQGRHDELLADLGTGISEFLAAMEDQGRADDVLVITTSEFGRRVAENGSLGTDHGNASVLFAAGAPVNGGLVGQPDLVNLVDGDLPIDIDARSLYAVALDWLGGPTDDILGAPYDRFDLLA